MADHGYICKKCGGPSPVGVGYVSNAPDAARQSSMRNACPCGYSHSLGRCNGEVVVETTTLNGVLFGITSSGVVCVDRHGSWWLATVATPPYADAEVARRDLLRKVA